MKARTTTLMAATVAALAAAAWTAPRLTRAETSAPSAGPAARDDAAAMESMIQLFQTRAQQDPFSAGDQASLAALFLQRARETGGHEDVVRAERAARRSLELRPTHNLRSLAVMMGSLLEQHRFVEARDAAAALSAADPENAPYRAALGEIQMELGEYGEAARIFASLTPAERDLDVAPRLARWHELSGRPAEARRLLYAARAEARLRPELPRERVAWFDLRVGDLELRHGRLLEAERAFREGLAVVPDDFRLLHAMARLEAARRRWSHSIAYGERVLGQLLDPATLALMSQVYQASGQPDKADEYAGVMAVAVQGQPTAYHREWSLFLLDHGERVPEVLEQVREELKTRRDVYGYDVLAWALHREGRNREAEAAMAQALRLGTRDPLLLFHSAMIQGALGRTATAEAQLVEALAINPRFHPVHAEGARAALDSLRGGRPWYRRLRP